LAFIGKYFQIEFIAYIGIVLFFLCGATSFFMGFVMMANNFNGTYKDVKEKDWKDQVW
jgi:putative Mn2+ efflux pump MntP